MHESQDEVIIVAEKDKGDIQVVARCAHTLRQLEPGSRLRLGPLAAELGAGRSTLHRYLTSMANADLLERVGDGEYSLGPLLAREAPRDTSAGRTSSWPSRASRPGTPWHERSRSTSTSCS